jgi:hypothetical protein
MEKSRMIKTILISVLIINISLLCDTSAFSALSLGDIEPTLGGTSGISYADSLVIKNHNPASWTDLTNTTYSISASYYLHELKSDDGVNSSFDRFTFEDMSLALPFGNRNVFGFAYYPVSVSDITGVTESGEEIPESFETTTLRTLEVKKGSISNASLIYGKGYKDFSFSINPSFKFGNYETTRRYKYTSYVADTEVIDWEKHFENVETTQILHFTLGGGVLYSSPYGLNFGAVITLPVSSYVNKIEKFDRTTSYGTVIENISYSEYEMKDAEWPFEFGAGLSYKVEKFILSYDYSAKLFEGIETGIDGSVMKDYSKNVLGISFDPRHKRYDPYYRRMVYSGYLSVEKRPYESNGNSIYDVTGTLGLNFPFNSERTNIELKLGYTKSGSIEDNGLRNDTFKIQFNFIASDRWRLKKERYND